MNYENQTNPTQWPIHLEAFLDLVYVSPEVPRSEAGVTTVSHAYKI